MFLTMLKSKLYGIRITDADLKCSGSITIDPLMLDWAAIREFEQVHVLDIENGERFITYVIKGKQGDVIVNGAAARLVTIGDPLIILTYGIFDSSESYYASGYPNKFDGSKFQRLVK